MLTIFNRPYADPVQLPLANGPVPILIIVVSYLVFVLKLGPQFMAKREPYQLRAQLKVYNIIQVLYNIILLIIFAHFVITEQPYDFKCIMVLPPEHEKKHIDRLLTYFYYLNKILDLMDTIFFVLRKSYKQVTLLHLIHHTYMPTAGYFLIRFYGYGGHVVFMGSLNVIIHCVMYSYYYLSSQSPAIKQSLWWKQYITILQLVQFVLMFSQSVWTLIQPNCEANRLVVYLVLFMSSLMFVMFTNFYVNAYVRTKNTITIREKLK